MKAYVISILSLLWRLISWIWSILFIGAAVGFLGNLIYTYFATGNITLADPRTLTIMSFIASHLIQLLFMLLLILIITICTFFAYSHQKRIREEHQRVHAEVLVDVAKGVRTALEKLNDKTFVSALPPSEQSSVNIQSVSSPAVIWNIPFRRNPFFTDREEILNQLQTRLGTDKMIALTQPQAISGLGGIGKTQAAVEYAYLHRKDY